MSDFVASFVPPEPGAGAGTHQSRFETNPIARDRLPDGELSFSFKDLLDTINPLQQIPVINWIYRAITGDRIALTPRLIGGALFGGPLGVLLAGIQACIEEMTGTAKEGGPMVALVRDIIGPGERKPADDGPATAAADAPKGEVVIELAPTAAVVQPAAAEQRAPETRQAPAAMPRPQPVNLPRGWASWSQSRGSLVSPTSFGAAPSPAETRPMQPTSADMGATSPAASARAAAPAADHANRLPNGATPDWVPSAMMHALEKYESARRLKRDEAPSVSTVQ